MRHAFAPLTAAAIAILAAHGGAQEVTVPVDGSYSERATDIESRFSQIDFLWTSQEFCGNAAMAARRRMDGRGYFVTSDVPVFASCQNGGNGTRIATTASTGITLVVERLWNDAVARLLDAAGDPLGPEFSVTGRTMNVTAVDVAALEGGSFVVAWSDFTGGSVHARVVFPDGSLPGGEVEVPAPGAGFSDSPRAVGLSDGNVMIAWLRSVGGTTDLVVRVLKPDLAAVTAEVQVSTGSARNATLAAGTQRVLLAWNQGQEARARFLDHAARFLGGELQIGTYEQPACAMNRSNQAVIAMSGSGSEGDVFALRIDSTGVLGAPFVVNGNRESWQGLAHAAMRDDGGFAIAWTSDEYYPGEELVARRYAFPVSLLLAPGPGPQNPPIAATLRPDGTAGFGAFTAYGTGGYGLNVGSAELDGDGTDELLTGPGPSGVFGPHVRAFEPGGIALGAVSFYAYGTLRYGVKVAGGSTDADAFDEVLTAPGEGHVFAPHVRGWNYDGNVVRPNLVSFFAYQTLKYGCEVAGAELDADGMDEILTAPGPGQSFGPLVRGFDVDGGRATAIAKINFWPYPGWRYGAHVTAADLESDGHGAYGDGYQEIVAGPGPDFSVYPAIRVYDYDGLRVTLKGIGGAAGYVGLRLAGGDVDAGDAEEVVACSGPHPFDAAQVSVLEWEPMIGYPYTSAPPGLQILGSGRFTWSGSVNYGGTVAVGDFE